MTVFALVRHGETDWNRDRRVQGSTDIPLNGTGREQALATGALLASRQWAALVTSPLSRASQTALLIGEQVGLREPQVDQRLTERDYGLAEGLTSAEIESRFPAGVEVPAQERREDVAERAVSALRDLAARYPGESVIVVAHGGVIRSVLETVAPGRHREPITNGSVHSFRLADGAVELVAFDDPIDEESIFPMAVDFEQQNRLAGREREGS